MRIQTVTCLRLLHAEATAQHLGFIQTSFSQKIPSTPSVLPKLCLSLNKTWHPVCDNVKCNRETDAVALHVCRTNTVRQHILLQSSFLFALKYIDFYPDNVCCPST